MNENQLSTLEIKDSAGQKWVPAVGFDTLLAAFLNTKRQLDAYTSRAWEHDLEQLTAERDRLRAALQKLERDAYDSFVVRTCREALGDANT